MTLSASVEEIILQHDTRGMTQLRQSLRPGYCRRAARLLLENRGTVLIGTGFPVSGSFESDGPIGAIALYRILEHLGCSPRLVCGPPLSEVLARDFSVHELAIAQWDETRPAAQAALKTLRPSLVVSVERPGVTADGRYYNMRRQDITEYTAKYDLFFEYCRCPTIAFGDGGNEIGMGKVRTALEGMNIRPAVTICDELVIATVSNWAVYGVVALLCHLLQEDLFELIDPAAVSEYLFAGGCLDGVRPGPEPSEDGFPIGVSLEIIAQLRKQSLPPKLQGRG
jgi:hypothetical protein